jgi:hypothetical protein
MFSVTTQGYDFGGSNVRVPATGGPHFPGGPNPVFNPGVHSAGGLSVNGGPVGGELITQLTEDHLVAASVAPIIYAFLLEDNEKNKDHRITYEKGCVIYLKRDERISANLSVRRKYGRGSNTFYVVARLGKDNATSTRRQNAMPARVDVIGILAEPVVFEKGEVHQIASVALEGLCDLNDFNNNIIPLSARPGDIVALRPAPGVAVPNTLTKYATLLVHETPHKWSVALHPGQLEPDGHQSGAAATTRPPPPAIVPGRVVPGGRRTQPNPVDAGLGLAFSELALAMTGTTVEPVVEIVGDHRFLRSDLANLCFAQDHLRQWGKAMQQATLQINYLTQTVWDGWSAITDFTGRQDRDEDAAFYNRAVQKWMEENPALASTAAGSNASADRRFEPFFGRFGGQVTGSRQRWFNYLKAKIEELGGKVFGNGTVWMIPNVYVEPNPVYSTVPTKTCPVWSSFVEYVVHSEPVCTLTSFAPERMESDLNGRYWPPTEDEGEYKEALLVDVNHLLHYYHSLWFANQKFCVQTYTGGFTKAVSASIPIVVPQQSDVDTSDEYAVSVLHSFAKESTNNHLDTLIELLGRSVRCMRAVPADPDSPEFGRTMQNVTACVKLLKATRAGIDSGTWSLGHYPISYDMAHDNVIPGPLRKAIEHHIASFEAYNRSSATDDGTAQLEAAQTCLGSHFGEYRVLFNGDNQYYELLPSLAAAACITDLNIYSVDNKPYEPDGSVYIGDDPLFVTCPWLCTRNGDPFEKFVSIESFCRKHLRDTQPGDWGARPQGESWMETLQPMIMLGGLTEYWIELYGYAKGHKPLPAETVASSGGGAAGEG